MSLTNKPQFKMKKALLFAAVLGAISFTSCSKTYVCTCTIAGVESTAEGEPGTTKEQAEIACETAEASLAGIGSCTL